MTETPGEDARGVGPEALKTFNRIEPSSNISRRSEEHKRGEPGTTQNQERDNRTDMAKEARGVAGQTRGHGCQSAHGARADRDASREAELNHLRSMTRVAEGAVNIGKCA